MLAANEVTITEVEVRPVALEMTSPFGIATGALTRADNVYFLLHLSSGEVGYGEAAPFPAVNGETSLQVVDELRAQRTAWIGQHVMDAEKLSQACRVSLCGSAKAALDMALVDAWTKSAGIALHHWFGSASSSVQTDFTLTTGEANLGSRAAELIHRGYRVLKVKVSGDIPLERERLNILGAACSGATLLLDGNAGLERVTDAMSLLQHADALGLNVTGFEQPFGKWEFAAHAELQAQTSVPVILDESIRGVNDIVKTHALRAARGINLKLQKTGVFETRQMYTVARALGLQVMMGAMVESAMGIAAATALVHGLGGISWVDLDTNHWLRADPTLHAHDFSTSDLRLAQKHVGHGVSLPR